MKITDISGLYIGHAKDEDFTILIAAEDKSAAQIVASEYAYDSGLNCKFDIKELPPAIDELKNICFDCDYILYP